MADEIVVDLVSEGCISTNNQVARLEHVQAILTIQAPRRGNIVITLTSPMNTTSILLPRRSLGNKNDSEL